jgi:hypothetical protein
MRLHVLVAAGLSAGLTPLPLPMLQLSLPSATAMCAAASRCIRSHCHHPATVLLQTFLTILLSLHKSDTGKLPQTCFSSSKQQQQQQQMASLWSHRDEGVEVLQAQPCIFSLQGPKPRHTRLR